MLIIHQMSKVASHAWLLAARRALGVDDGQILHCHFMMPANRERIMAAVNRPAADRSIANMVMLNETLRRGATAWEGLLAARQAHGTVRVISGIRDPVARSVSIIMYMADFFGHVDRPLHPRGALTPEYVIEYLRENWRLVLDQREPRGSFEWLLWYLTGAYRTWFSEELAAAFGVDVRQTRFDANQACERISVPGLDLLIYRVEDMAPAAPSHSSLVAHASDFLQAQIQGFPAVNSSTLRRSREVSETVRRRFTLPAAMLAGIYGDPIVRHFYSGEEIATFIARWRE